MMDFDRMPLFYRVGFKLTFYYIIIGVVFMVLKYLYDRICFLISN